MAKFLKTEAIIDKQQKKKSQIVEKQKRYIAKRC